jgi:hypothetical protein
LPLQLDTQCLPMAAIDISNVGASGPLAEKKCIPVIREGLKSHGDLQRPFLNVLQATFFPQFRKFTRAAQRHMRLVQFFSFWIDDYGGIPECAEHSHSARIIPNRRRDAPARLRYPSHLAECLLAIRNEIEDQQ